MAKKTTTLTPEQRIERKLDDLIRVMEDLFILEACRAGMDGAAIRAHLGIGMNRVTDISKRLD